MMCAAVVVVARSSFFQTVCLLGYCVFPLCISALISVFLPYFFVRMGLVAFAFIWATIGSCAPLLCVLPLPWCPHGSVRTDCPRASYARTDSVCLSVCWMYSSACARPLVNETHSKYWLHGRASTARAQGAGCVSGIAVLRCARLDGTLCPLMCVCVCVCVCVSVLGSCCDRQSL